MLIYSQAWNPIFRVGFKFCCKKSSFLSSALSSLLRPLVQKSIFPFELACSTKSHGNNWLFFFKFRAVRTRGAALSPTSDFAFFCKVFSFSKCDHFSKGVFIFKMWFFFKSCFHFQNVKGFVRFFSFFSKRHNCKQKSVQSLQIALLMRLS